LGSAVSKSLTSALATEKRHDGSSIQEVYPYV